MLKPSSSPRSSLTLDDGMMLWRARERYHVQRFLSSLTLTLFLLEGLGFLLMGRWALACLVCGIQWGVFVGGRWLLRWSGRGLRRWWHGAVVVLALSIALSGCESMAREVVKLHGVKVDPFPGPCAPESVKTGQCMPVAQQQGGRP